MKKTKKSKQMKMINQNAAGIDIGSEEHYVCVPKDRAEQNVRCFPSYTEDLHKCAKWLKECKIETVVMESTGVFWIPLFQILETYGFEVFLVNAKHVKNVPGRKTDVLDSQWLQKLHTFGLLQGSFRPSDDICVLRSYVRYRDTLVHASSSHLQRMQKALTQMNIQLHKVISDITGETGERIIQAILSGERDLEKLSKLKGKKIKNPTEIIKKSLEGDYRDEHLFVLQQEYDFYKICQKKIDECDVKIETWINKIESNTSEDFEEASKDKLKTPRSNTKNIHHLNIHNSLILATGVDITEIDGLNTLSALKLISEVGVDMSKWKTDKHFSSWLGLCPGSKITGGKLKSGKTRNVVNPAATTFRLAAMSLSNSKSALGGFYRRMRGRLGAPKAITATANKLSKIFYNMIKNKTEYIDVGVDYYEKKYKNRVIKNLQKKAKEYGYELIENQ